MVHDRQVASRRMDDRLTRFRDVPPIPDMSVDCAKLLADLRNRPRARNLVTITSAVLDRMIGYEEEVKRYHAMVVDASRSNRELIAETIEELSRLRTGSEDTNDVDRIQTEHRRDERPRTSSIDEEPRVDTGECDISEPQNNHADELTTELSPYKDDARSTCHDDEETTDRVEVEAAGTEVKTEAAGDELLEHELSEVSKDEIFQFILYDDSNSDPDLTEAPASEEHIEEIDKILSRDSGELICTFCGRSFRSFKTYDRHVQSHTREASLKCPSCPQTCATAPELKRHARTHTLTHACTRCPKRYNDAKLLEIHVATHDVDPASLSCEICHKQFKYPIHLVKHALYHAPYVSKPANARPYTKLCDLCGRKFTHQSALHEHMRTHSAQKSFGCHECGKMFHRRQSMLNHLTVHSAVFPFECQFCDRKFRRLGGRERHERVHTGARPFKCRFCDKSFPDGGIRIGHEKIHLGVRTFECAVCEKKFMFAAGLTKHMRTHTDERPYACDTCGKRFRRTNTLKNHQRTHTGERPYFCHICGKSYPKNLSEHLKTHRHRARLECRVCGESFNTPARLSQHYKMMPAHAAEMDVGQ